MATDTPVKEEFVAFHGYQVWYRIVGAGEAPGKLPLLCLHGGPGAPQDYLEPLEALAASGRRVIFYDQLGAGNSDHPHNPALWTVPLFMEELGAHPGDLRPLRRGDTADCRDRPSGHGCPMVWEARTRIFRRSW